MPSCTIPLVVQVGVGEAEDPVLDQGSMNHAGHFVRDVCKVARQRGSRANRRRQAMTGPLCMTPSKGRRLRFRQTSDHLRPGTGSGERVRNAWKCQSSAIPSQSPDSEAEAHSGPKGHSSWDTRAHRPARRTSRRADEARGRGGAGIPLGCRIPDGSKRVTPRSCVLPARIDAGQTGAPTGARIHLATSRLAPASSSCPFPASVRRQPGSSRHRRPTATAPSARRKYASGVSAPPANSTWPL